MSDLPPPSSFHVMSFPLRFVRFGVPGLLFLLAIPLVAQERRSRPPAVPPAVAHQPLAIPDRVILTWNGDPAHSQAVTWRTDTSVERAIAQLAEATHGPEFQKSARTVEATTQPFTSDLGPAHYHSVTFAGLAPSTLYTYRVGDGTNWSEWFQFRTASEEPEPFSFIYFGDAQNDLKSLWSRVIRQAYSDDPKARFLLHAGDLINVAPRDAEWGDWHYAGGWVNGMIPSVPTPGNHEYGRGRDLKPLLAPHWRPTFTLPEHGPKGLEETVYYLDYQGVRIISLNSNERQEEQIPWLERVLAENPNRWTILTFHHPLFNAAKGRENEKLRNLWQPVFDRYRVDLVLQGHDHTYARSNLMSGANVRDPEAGTVYVVSVSGPKLYNVEREPWMKRVAEDTQLYQVISIDGGRLRYQARTATGELYDAFDLLKRDGEPNELINRIPKRMPERLRPPAPAATAR
ncbi:MAG: fibronectin type III domain-containing protein [Armatimonadota bacterium]